MGEDQWEEVDWLPGPAVGGNNFGWPFVEGRHCFSPAVGCDSTGLVSPVLEIRPQPRLRGGRRLRVPGEEIPGSSRQPISTATSAAASSGGCGGQAAPWSPPLPRFRPPLTNDNIVSFGEDADGESVRGDGVGRIYRIALAVVEADILGFAEGRRSITNNEHRQGVPVPTKSANDERISRERLIELLNEDLAREYQAIIAYVVYSQVIKGRQVHDDRQGTGDPRR